MNLNAYSQVKNCIVAEFIEHTVLIDGSTG